MSAENIVFGKIREISARGMRPRPQVTALQIASELSVTSASLLASLAQLRQLRLVNFCDSKALSIKLTLLGSVANLDR